MLGNYIPNLIKIHEKLIKLLRFEDVKKPLLFVMSLDFSPYFNDFSQIFDSYLEDGGLRAVFFLEMLTVFSNV